MERLSRLLQTFRLVQEMDIVKSLVAMQVRDDDDDDDDDDRKKTKNAAFYTSSPQCKYDDPSSKNAT
jgi:hypothetical protein